MSDKALITTDNGFELIQRQASALYSSGYFGDVQSKAQAIVKVMAGAELGLPPFASMTGIHIIQGKPVLGANLIATLVKNDPRYDYRIDQCTDTGCMIEWRENGRTVGVSTFTIEEARDAKLTGKDNWKKYPSDMLFARAISRGARRFAPGIFGGSPVYTPEELGADVDPDGYIVEGETVDEPKPADLITDAKEESINDVPDTPAEPTESPQSETFTDIDSQIADARAWLEEKCDGNHTQFGFVLDAAAMTPHYNAWKHALYAITGNDEKPGYEFPNGFNIERKQKITCKGSLLVFDWLMDRKAD